MVVQTSRGLHYTTATTLGGMLQERAEGPQGADCRFLFVREDDTPSCMVPEGED